VYVCVCFNTWNAESCVCVCMSVYTISHVIEPSILCVIIKHGNNTRLFMFLVGVLFVCFFCHFCLLGVCV